VKSITVNENKICFITCVNNEELYEHSLRYIRKLTIPHGYEVETIAVEDAKSLTGGYNQGMQMSDAKYKVYLHQDVWILHQNFVVDILELFHEHQNVGLIGVIGTKRIPQSGIWWESDQKEGKVVDSHTGTLALLDFQSTREKITQVEAVDGLLFATQVDMKFRDDLFDGWHFYDISQCLEFQKKGYKVAVPYQMHPWCIHYCGRVDLTRYEEYRQIFINEYRKEN